MEKQDLERVEVVGKEDHFEEMSEEEARNELERLEKLDQERKRFLKELQASESGAENDEARMRLILTQTEKFTQFLFSHLEKAPELATQPHCLKGGQLKSYQLDGINWLMSLYQNNISGVLADDMGLGKRVQTIAFLAFLKELKQIKGPHLLIGPKSTLENWLKEFQKWLPSAKVKHLQGFGNEVEYLQQGKFDIYVTSEKVLNKSNSWFSPLNWKCVITEEAFCLPACSVLEDFSGLRSHSKLFLTSTPLKNIAEICTLFSLLLPDLFSSELFNNWPEFNINQNAEEHFTNQFQQPLKYFTLRRTKSDIRDSLPPKKEVFLFTPLSEKQVYLYKKYLSLQPQLSSESKNDYPNLMMQLKKVCNHPYFFQMAEEEGAPALGDHLINASGKMIILDKLLEKLFKEGHQVLIFCQMTKMLDILEDYCNFRQYKYCRIDGNTDVSQRNSKMAEFTKPDSGKFVFLLSTRAGGLGLKLDTADTVILYDSDVNPQMDTLAIERAYNLSQQNPVTVYRLVTENSVEEKILDLQLVKLKQDLLDTQQGQTPKQSQLSTISQVKEIISYGGGEVLQISDEMKDEDIEIILERNEKKTVERKKLLGIEDFEEEKEP